MSYDELTFEFRLLHDTFTPESPRTTPEAAGTAIVTETSGRVF